MYKALLLLFLLSITGCTQRGEEKAGRPIELMFDINPELLGEIIRLDDKGIGFQPPKEWRSISDEVFAEAVSQIKQSVSRTDLFSLRPLYVFLHHDRNSTLIVSVITSDSTFSNPSELVESYRVELNGRLHDSDYKETDFLKDGIHFYQYLIQSDDIVNFKFLLQNRNRELFQLDYIVPRAVYAIESKAIESSIGSIHVFNN
jgi:hypothetical protein